jgi:thymidylate synthase
MTNSLNQGYHDLINKIETEGLTSSPRGLAVKELEVYTLQIDPNFAIPDFHARPFNFRYLMGELAWYMKQDRKIDYINNFSSFWKNIANSEGEIWSNYGHLLFGPQLQWALESLQKDPNTRQAISFVSRPAVQYVGNKDFVCTMYLNFWIRNNKLNMKVQMRSNDVFYGLTYDAPFFSFIQQSMYYWLLSTYPELELGTYYHCADNIHYYERHFDIAQEILQEEVKNPYFFLLKKPLFTIDSSSCEWTEEGENFIKDVDSLLESKTKITQEKSQEILSRYFFIQ